ncbi:maternal protein exuperantia-2-like [Drosophila miranda]|uniref:maternal protein exuperantia-2-like n=1 Tax=Drosophila miranda TaxID=7229 RepID=UPI00143F80F7|nr:maternal protein exuperantia-2-like [Drosophila miranda]
MYHVGEIKSPAIDSLKTEEMAELLNLLDSYYDPSKATIKPKSKRSGNGNGNATAVMVTSTPKPIKPPKTFARI